MVVAFISWVTIFVSPAVGFFVARSIEFPYARFPDQIDTRLPVTPLDITLAVVGLVVGVVVTVLVFGVVATLYDIRDSLRVLTAQGAVQPVRQGSVSQG